MYFSFFMFQYRGRNNEGNEAGEKDVTVDSAYQISLTNKKICDINRN